MGLSEREGLCVEVTCSLYKSSCDLVPCWPPAAAAPPPASGAEDVKLGEVAAADAAAAAAAASLSFSFSFCSQ